MEHLKTKLYKIIENFKRPDIVIKHNEELLNYLKSQIKYPTNSIKEMIYLYQNPDFSPICEMGNKRIFLSNQYKNGCGGYCECVRKIQKIKNKNNSEKYTKEKKLKIKIKKIQTNLKKYGVENPFQNQEIQKKSQKTMETKYGAKFSGLSQSLIKKQKQTLLKKYGVDHNWKIEDVKNKKEQSYLNKYGVKNPSQKHITQDNLKILMDSFEFKKLVENKTLLEIKQILGVNTTTIASYASKYDCRSLIKSGFQKSQIEIKIEDFCQLNQISYVKNDRNILNSKELDFYFPQVGVALECNGLYWHSELGGGKHSLYHYNKWQLCKQKNIDLYQYFEDEINNKFNIIASKILYLNKKHLGKRIGARKLYIDWLCNWKDEMEFYNNNHIQGPRQDRTHVIGAWLDPFSLVACMSIRVKNNSAEIVRFATDITNIYPGAFNRMLAWFVNKTNFTGDVFSWSDNRHSNGALYKNNGFEFVRDQNPGYFVTDYQTRWRREHFMKNKIKQRHPEVDLNKTEWQLEQELGYDRIWDAGKRLWKKTIKSK